MNAVSLRDLTDAITKSWSAGTSANAEKWNVNNPSLGQCAVTSCVMQDYFGEDILNSVVILPDGSTDSHYYNLINDEAVDLTKQQFPAGSSFSEGQPKTKGFASTRDYCLSYPSTRQRYNVLKAKVELILAR